MERAVAADSREFAGYERLKAIVCLATPFAYVKAAKTRDAEHLVAAIAHGITSTIIVTIFAMRAFAFNWISFLLVCVIELFPPAILSFLLLGFEECSKSVHSGTSVHSLRYQYFL